ncbi:MAG: glycosyltransferase family 1 protein [Verrucomicrobiae bacterium]|nr:glycosyltransferase family 1 protein [Verrucomicrobiae bacterium]
MKISIVTDTFPPEMNGVARTLERLVSGLVTRHHTVTVVHPGKQKQSPPADCAAEEQYVWGLAVPMYSCLRMGLPRKHSFLREWNEERPDVVYIATESLMGYSALRAAVRLSIPVVTGYHTHFPKYLRHYAPSLENIAHSYLRHLHNQSECTVTPSRDVAFELHGSGYHNVTVMGRGVDTGLFHPDKRDALLRQEWNAREGTIVLLCVGRVAVEKNLPVAFRAYQHLQRRYPDIRCVCVGDGPARESLMKSYPDVIWPGAKYGGELARYYASADVFLFPSLTETYGNVLPEAMASGLVPVAYCYAACAEIVRNGSNGFCADTNGGDAAFTSTVNQAIARRDDWKVIRATAKETAKSLSWDTVIRQFEFILTQAAQCPPQSAQ